MRCIFRDCLLDLHSFLDQPANRLIRCGGTYRYGIGHRFFFPLFPITPPPGDPIRLSLPVSRGHPRTQCHWPPATQSDPAHAPCSLWASEGPPAVPLFGRLRVPGRQAAVVGTARWRRGRTRSTCILRYINIAIQTCIMYCAYYLCDTGRWCGGLPPHPGRKPSPPSPAYPPREGLRPDWATHQAVSEDCWAICDRVCTFLFVLTVFFVFRGERSAAQQ